LEDLKSPSRRTVYPDGVNDCKLKCIPKAKFKVQFCERTGQEMGYGAHVWDKLSGQFVMEQVRKWTSQLGQDRDHYEAHSGHANFEQHITINRSDSAGQW
jgi:hypothetical protein